MSKKKKKTSTHYVTHDLDRGVWGRIICIKSGPATKKRKAVTCKKCIRAVEWNPRRYEASRTRPLVLL